MSSARAYVNAHLQKTVRWPGCGEIMLLELILAFGILSLYYARFLVLPTSRLCPAGGIYCMTNGRHHISLRLTDDNPEMRRVNHYFRTSSFSSFQSEFLPGSRGARRAPSRWKPLGIIPGAGGKCLSPFHPLIPELLINNVHNE